MGPVVVGGVRNFIFHFSLSLRNFYEAQEMGIYIFFEIKKWKNIFSK